MERWLFKEDIENEEAKTLVECINVLIAFQNPSLKKVPFWTNHIIESLENRWLNGDIYKHGSEADGWMTKVYESESMLGLIVGTGRWMYWWREMER